MRDMRADLQRIMEENADPVGLLSELRQLFAEFAESEELGDDASRAYRDAMAHLENARSEFTRRGIR
jgi:capsule polysaccharide export protein KpsE/RkpR